MPFSSRPAIDAFCSSCHRALLQDRYVLHHVCSCAASPPVGAPAGFSSDPFRSSSILVPFYETCPSSRSGRLLCCPALPPPCRALATSLCGHRPTPRRMIHRTALPRQAVVFPTRSMSFPHRSLFIPFCTSHCPGEARLCPPLCRLLGLRLVSSSAVRRLHEGTAPTTSLP